VPGEVWFLVLGRAPSSNVWEAILKLEQRQEEKCSCFPRKEQDDQGELSILP